MTSNQVAYVATAKDDHTTWQISICIKGEAGHRPLSDYAGPYDKARAEAIAQRLNTRLGVTETVAKRVVASTMPRPYGSSRTTVSTVDSSDARIAKLEKALRRLVKCVREDGACALGSARLTRALVAAERMCDEE